MASELVDLDGTSAAPIGRFASVACGRAASGLGRSGRDRLQSEYKRTVHQFNFTVWPDFGCPESPELLLDFVRVVRSHTPRVIEGPILAHCR